MVVPTSFESLIKNIGNSHTCPRDLYIDNDVKIIIYALSESVGIRLMEAGFYATTVDFFVNNDLTVWTKRRKLPVPTNISGEIAYSAFSLFKKLMGIAYAPS